RRARQHVRVGHSQGARILDEDRAVAVGQLGDGRPLARGAPNELVVHVGDVHDPRDVVAAVTQVAHEQIVEQEGPEVADVRRGVNRQPAAIDAYAAVLERLELLHLPRARVAHADRHDADRSKTVATARALITRPAPSSPARLPVEAFTLTCPTSKPRPAAMAARMPSTRSRPRCGRPPAMLTSTSRGA